MDGPFYSSKVRKRANGSKENIQLNAKAMHTLFCALGPEEYSRVSSCSNANKIWDKLEVTHEETNQLKKSKIGILTLNYETFKKMLEEDIKAISDRFTIIINGLKSYGKTYPNEEVVRKMLRILPKFWTSKVTIIKESKNLETLTLDKLICSLLIHEMRLSERVKEVKVEKKKIGVAIKSTTNEENESSDEVDEDKEMTMFAKTFKRFMKSNKGIIFQRKEGLKLEPNKEKDLIICYECKKLGHIKFDCPQRKKNESIKQKHKANVATLSNEDSSNNDK
ncbi:zf-CCHC domain-containing protein/UBN2 domain-containing protein [Gossypium australe]|uniref:Zf-CCHC domain-containing protein/UBN2 domain-containing protein n=1 Tax=Gossypium australe TaxID=47621 RepID=A0A5B6VVS8_9ROSI|nr:zf-CCHC domain-containing protein/UBN2 domain-containing protein [Gossypium australe]